jgi:16S rRNA G966 N2-methylase RsmD
MTYFGFCYQCETRQKILSYNSKTLVCICENTDIKAVGTITSNTQNLEEFRTEVEIKNSTARNQALKKVFDSIYIDT